MLDTYGLWERFRAMGDDVLRKERASFLREQNGPEARSLQEAPNSTDPTKKHSRPLSAREDPSHTGKGIHRSSHDHNRLPAPSAAPNSPERMVYW